MQPYISKAEAERVLEPHLTALCEPVYEAWRKWDELGAAARQPLTPRTRANWIFDMAVQHAKATLDVPPTFTYTEQMGFLIVTVEDTVAVRYKKLDDEFGIRGIRTGQFKMWGNQALPGLDPLTHLVAGYQVSEYGKLAGVAIVCARGRRVLWHIDAPAPAAPVRDINEAAEQAETTVRPLKRPGEGTQASDV